jgi:hypothetical protein
MLYLGVAKEGIMLFFFVSEDKAGETKQHKEYRFGTIKKILLIKFLLIVTIIAALLYYYS